MTDVDLWQVLLIRAARILARDGWTQDGYYAGSRCSALGALVEAAGRVDSPALDEAILRLEKRVGRSIHVWNDQRGQTASNVIATLKDVAALG